MPCLPTTDRIVTIDDYNVTAPYVYSAMFISLTVIPATAEYHAVPSQGSSRCHLVPGSHAEVMDVPKCTDYAITRPAGPPVYRQSGQDKMTDN